MAIGEIANRNEARQENRELGETHDATAIFGQYSSEAWQALAQAQQQQRTLLRLAQGHAISLEPGPLAEQPLLVRGQLLRPLSAVRLH